MAELRFAVFVSAVAIGRNPLGLLLVMLPLLLGCSDDDPLALGSVGVVDVVKGFEYYGPCGKETLTIDGKVFYPLFPDELAALDIDLYPTEPTDSSEQGLIALLAVGPPGPGDDVGTLLVYDDGIARFEAESGQVTWLSDEQRTYDWDC